MLLLGVGGRGRSQPSCPQVGLFWFSMFCVVLRASAVPRRLLPCLSPSSVRYLAKE